MFRPTLLPRLLLIAALTCLGACGDAVSDIKPDAGPADAVDASEPSDSVACVAGEADCECLVDTDCLAKEDGDPCNGTLYCDAAARACKVNPATVIDCPAAKAPCLAVACDPSDGACRPLPDDEGGACDDGESCTKDDACTAGVCVGQSVCACKGDADCADFDDGDLCNGVLYCDVNEGTCKLNPGSVVQCSPYADGPCATTACDPKTGKCGKQKASDGKACDLDGLDCTDDLCQGGVCLPGPASATCGCQKQADCAAQEDGDACNGTLFCNLASQSCELDPTTVVHCPTVDDGPCQAASCMPKTGKCTLVALADATPCDDSNPCTGQSACKSGACAGSAPLCACKADKDCANFALADACKGSLYCDKAVGWCALNPATATICSGEDDTTCLHNVCDPQDGKCKATAVVDGTPCEHDGTWCTGVDTCKAGQCGAGANKCACQADGDCAKFEDGNACNGTLFCDKSSGKCVVNPTTTVTCDGGKGSCSPEVCDPAKGVCAAKPVSDGTPCDTDLSPCTAERCDTGKCVIKTNKCLCPKGDICDAWEDGNPCNGALFCNKAVEPPACQVNPATLVKCKPGDPSACVAPTCDPADGLCKLKPVKEGLACTDDDICTLAETCEGGACVQLAGGASVVCDDNDGCTDDACVKGKGCTFVNNEAPCDDGDPCEKDDVCSAGGCVAGEAIQCDDGKPCTTDSCEHFKGCVAVAATDGLKCDDGDGCTSNEMCAQGLCVGSSATEGNLFFDTGLQAEDANNLVVANVDGQGAEDLLLLGKSQDDDKGKQQAWLATGNGKGGFAKAQVLWTEPACANSFTGYPLAHADLDKDGLPEMLLVRGYNKSECAVGAAPFAWAWSGKITLGAAPSMALSPLVSVTPEAESMIAFAPTGIVAGDLLKGGDPEVAVFGAFTAADGKPSNRLLLLTKTSGSWKVHQKLTAQGGPVAGDRPLRMEVMDLDGDQDLDLFVTPQLPAEWTLTTRIYINDAGTFSEVDLGIAGAFAALDWDADGQTDLLWQPLLEGGKLKLGQAIRWRHNDGTKQWFSKGADDVLVASDGSGFLFLGAGQLDTPGPLDLIGLSKDHLVLWPDVSAKGSGVNGIKVGLWTDETPTFVVSAFGAVQTAMTVINGSLIHYVINVSPCVDGEACTKDVCVGGKCEHQPNSAYCDDGNECTEGDSCVGGKCKDGSAQDCTDSNPCTTDSCEPQGGCKYVDNDGAACTDDNACTKDDKCGTGSCNGDQLSCDDKNVCTTDFCDQGQGCVNQANSGGCDDGSPCTESDQCQGGKCSGGEQKSCDDGNACTDDACDGQQDCQHVDNSAGCDDGDACSKGEKCGDGSCGGGSSITCDDASICTTDSCDAQKGCVFVNNSAACSDGDPCTAADFCKSGKCEGGPPKSCDDKNACTTDSCESGKGCVTVNNTAACNDANVCTTNDACKDGKCGGANVADGSGCGGGSTCQSGVCKAP